MKPVLPEPQLWTTKCDFYCLVIIYSYLMQFHLMLNDSIRVVLFLIIAKEIKIGQKIFD